MAGFVCRFVLLSLMLTTTGAGQETRPVLSRRDLALRLRELQAETLRLFKAKDYAAAAEKCRQGMSLMPRSSLFPYNLACALARQGKAAEAIEALRRAVELGYAGPDHMQADEDLASLREKKEFAALLEKARANLKRSVGRYEPGEKIGPLRTVEGNPEGGLRWRLRISTKASEEKPHRLIIWLHPAGGSMNRRVERMAKGFVRDGFALLVFTQKDFRFWSGSDAKKMLKITLPEVARVDGVDADRPILMGYSAGGQMALHLYQAEPGRYGGLVLDAAYPVRRAGGRMSLAMPPDDPAVRTVPFLVLVGDRDGGAGAWRRAEKRWRQKGVPLTVRYVPGKGHAWLFGKEQTAELRGWLREVAAGKLPGLPATMAPATRPASLPKDRPPARPG